MYHYDLQRTYDTRVTMDDWKPFFEGLRNDWQGIVINVRSFHSRATRALIILHQAAVLLNANIAFLAIPDVFSPAPTSLLGNAMNYTVTSYNATNSNVTSYNVSSSLSTSPPGGYITTSDRIKTAIVTASLISVALSLSSIIVGLILLKQSGSDRAKSERDLVSNSSTRK